MMKAACSSRKSGQARGLDGRLSDFLLSRLSRTWSRMDNHAVIPYSGKAVGSGDAPEWRMFEDPTRWVLVR